MKEVFGNIWDFHRPKQLNTFLVFTTNGSVRKDGHAVMGRGIAREVAVKFPHVQAELGKHLKEFGNKIFIFWNEKLISFPVKHKWDQKADPELIEKSCQRLLEMVNSLNFENVTVYMVRTGCGNGGLEWKDVKPVLEKYLDDRFVVVERKKGT